MGHTHFNPTTVLKCQSPLHAPRGPPPGGVVGGLLGAADELGGAILAQQHLRGPKPSVVVVAHRVAMGPGVVNDEQVAALDLGKLPVHGELVVVLAEAARDVVGPRGRPRGLVRSARLPHHGDVVVGAVHGRSDEVHGARVNAEVVLVDVLLVYGARDQAAVRPHHEAAHLGEDGHVAHAGGHEDLLEGAPHALADGADVTGLLVRPVRDPHAAGEVDKPDVRAGLIAQADRQPKEDARERGIVVVAVRVAGEERVQPQRGAAALDEHAVRLEELLLGHAVLGVARVVHDAVGQAEEPAGVEAAARDRAHGPRLLLEERDVRDVVEVHDGAELAREAEVLGRRVVGREHDLLARHAERSCDEELSVAGAVAAAAVLQQDLDERGVGVGLDGEVLPEARVPREGVEHRLRVAADAGLVVQVEGGGVPLGDVDELVGGHKRLLHACHASSLDSAPAGFMQTVLRVFPAGPPRARARAPSSAGSPPREVVTPAGCPADLLARTSIE